MEEVLILGVNVNDDEKYHNYSMDELSSLAYACGFHVAHRISQRLEKVNASTYVGTGKISEIITSLNNLRLKTIIVNDNLTPIQQRNLEELTEAIVIDRTALILHIFALRAKTKEAKLQVEIATLKYSLPRLVVSEANLAQQRGGVGSKIRGLGEKQIDLDRYKVRKKISKLEEELKEVAQVRDNQRRQRRRNDIPLVAIVGYTNAGKSSLFNLLSNDYSNANKKDVFVKDMLFATLDTSVRKITLKGNKSFLLSDTVGFVSDLPTELVKAFYSTLEEVQEADLILNMIDISDPYYLTQNAVVLQTLRSLKVDLKKVVTVYNKVDKLADTIDLVEISIKGNVQNIVLTSVIDNFGIDELIKTIDKNIFSNYVKTEMFIPYENIQDYAYLNQVANVIEPIEKEEGVYFELESSLNTLRRYIQYSRKSH